MRRNGLVPLDKKNAGNVIANCADIGVGIDSVIDINQQYNSQRLVNVMPNDRGETRLVSAVVDLPAPRIASEVPPESIVG